MRMRRDLISAEGVLSLSLSSPKDDFYTAEQMPLYSALRCTDLIDDDHKYI